jgi:hypothetical protein
MGEEVDQTNQMPEKITTPREGLDVPALLEVLVQAFSKSLKGTGLSAEKLERQEIVREGIPKAVKVAEERRNDNQRRRRQIQSLLQTPVW